MNIPGRQMFEDALGKWWGPRIFTVVFSVVMLGAVGAVAFGGFRAWKEIRTELWPAANNHVAQPQAPNTAGMVGDHFDPGQISNLFKNKESRDANRILEKEYRGTWRSIQANFATDDGNALNFSTPIGVSIACPLGKSAERLKHLRSGEPTIIDGKINDANHMGIGMSECR